MMPDKHGINNDGDDDDGDDDDGDDDDGDDDDGDNLSESFDSGAKYSMLHSSPCLLFPDSSFATSSRSSRWLFSSPSLPSLAIILISRLRKDFFGPGFEFSEGFVLKRKFFFQDLIQNLLDYYGVLGLIGSEESFVPPVRLSQV